MLKHLISQGDWAVWPQISTVIFAVTFAGILLYVTRGKSRQHYDYMAGLVLDEGGVTEEDGHGR